VKHIAQDLRRNQTDAEQLLWGWLRARRLCGFKFRRQEILGPYVADFACLEPKLVIEVDGGQHAEQARQDARRTEYLEALGYRVIRFWDDEVLRDRDAVLEEILTLPSPGAIARQESSSPGRPSMSQPPCGEQQPGGGPVTVSACAEASATEDRLREYCTSGICAGCALKAHRVQ